MAITTYAELKTSGENWTDRTDLSSFWGDFITLFEKSLNGVIHARQQVTTDTLTPSSGSASLPSDYGNWKRVTWTGSPRRNLEYVDPAFFQMSYSTDDGGLPTFFTIEGSTLRINSSDATTLTLAYEQTVPALSDGATSNWFLAAHPDYYMAGMLAASRTMTGGQNERAAAWVELKTISEAAADMLQRRKFAQGGPAMIRPIGATP